MELAQPAMNLESPLSTYGIFPRNIRFSRDSTFELQKLRFVSFLTRSEKRDVLFSGLGGVPLGFCVGPATPRKRHSLIDFN